MGVRSGEQRDCDIEKLSNKENMYVLKLKGQLQLNIITVIKIKKPIDFIRILMYNIFEVVRMPMNSREMIRFLKRNGFTEIKGGKGSHRRFKNFDTGKVTEVPCHSGELNKNLERAILRQAGLK